MFDSLTERIQGVLNKLRGRGKLTEADVNDALREVRRALLEADVSLAVVKEFINQVKTRAIGEELWKSLTPGQLVVKHVRDCLVELMGGTQADLELADSPPTVILMVGLHGAGKTTSTGKLALFMKNRGFKPLLAATDIYRPAAIKQLEVLGNQLGIPVYQLGENASPLNICRGAYKQAKENGNDVLLIDTAGRLHVEKELMDELKIAKEEMKPQEVLLVVDAMTGQDAVNIASQFSEQIGITGVVMTKLDGDARGGAALSVRQVTGAPIKYIGIGEKSSALEPFHPDRMASRILGMGDVMSLIEKAEQAIDEEQAQLLEKKIRENQFDLDDFLKQMQQIRKLGSITDLLSMLPGVGSAIKDLPVDEKAISRMEAIIQSMTAQERRRPEILNASRKKRVAKGSGNQVAEVNRLVKHFDMVKNMMKMFTGPKPKFKKGSLPFRLPF
ncbi:MAG: signal recognition particle protein [Candidatus Eremiobacteraeota bacterium]|nr:signal recognition particle protein [Candidatus Eremiobacteraeota bacterium]MCW5872232.1 signal recognition particle protein [Candidatus Eremiobacteraeota bacterium]